eukprot:5410063-Alexandrium_andersonii.AAC.1
MAQHCMAWRCTMPQKPLFRMVQHGTALYGSTQARGAQAGTHARKHAITHTSTHTSRRARKQAQ